ncbi:hypothetical protein RRG08_014134, partial [Elysia crispata]
YYDVMRQPKLNKNMHKEKTKRVCVVNTAANDYKHPISRTPHHPALFLYLYLWDAVFTKSGSRCT